MSLFFRQIARDAASDAAAAAGGGGGDAAAQAAAAAAAAKSAGGGSGGGGDDAAKAAAAAAAAAPPPFFKGLYGDDGRIDKTALDRLPDSLKPFKDQFAKYDTVESLLQGFGNAHTMAVKKALTPLTGTEPPEIVKERNELLDTINNVPKDPKGYGIARPEDLPEMFWNQPGADEFGKIAQQNHLSPAAVKDLLALQLKITRGEIERGKAMEAEYYSGQDKAFETEMQKQGVDLTKAMDLATRAAATLGIDPKSPIFKNADVRKALVRFSNLVSEDKLGAITPADGGTQNEREMALDIARNPQNPLYKAFNDPVHPNHQAAKDRWNELYRIWGEKAKKRGEIG